MAMTRQVFILFVVFSHMISGFILPLIKPSGDPDLTSIINHVTLMESSMSKLETQVQASHDQLIVVNERLKSTSDVLARVTAELKTTQERLRSAESEILTLKNDKKQRPTPFELTLMKADIADLKSHKAQHSNVNLTIVDVMSRDLKTNTAAIQVLRSKVDANSVKINITNSNTTQRSHVHDQLNVVKADLKTTQTRLSSAEADIITLQHDKKTNSGAIQVLQSKVEANSVNINNTRLDGELNGLQLRKLRDEVTHLSTDVNNTRNVAKTMMTEVLLKTQQNNVESNTTRQAVSTLESLAMLTHVEVHKALVNIHSLELHLTQLSSQLSSLQHNLENHIGQVNTNVAFKVTQSVNKSGWTTLHFDTVDFNQGGGYNSTSGYFTAPVSGTYLFWCNIMLSNSAGRISIYKGSSSISQGVTYSRNNQIAMTVVTHMDKGDQVHFTAASTTTVTNSYSHYGGAILHV